MGVSQTRDDLFLDVPLKNMRTEAWGHCLGDLKSVGEMPWTRFSPQGKSSSERELPVRRLRDLNMDLPLLLLLSFLLRITNY